MLQATQKCAVHSKISSSCCVLSSTVQYCPTLLHCCCCAASSSVAHIGSVLVKVNAPPWRNGRRNSREAATSEAECHRGCSWPAPSQFLPHSRHDRGLLALCVCCEQVAVPRNSTIPFGSGYLMTVKILKRAPRSDSCKIVDHNP